MKDIKRLFGTIFFALFSIVLMAQNTTPNIKSVAKPYFFGGESALNKWIDEQAKYPAKALKNGIQGCVECVFTIAEGGYVISAKVIGAADTLLSKEALHLLDKLPNWVTPTSLSQEMYANFYFYIDEHKNGSVSMVLQGDIPTQFSSVTCKENKETIAFYFVKELRKFNGNLMNQQVDLLFTIDATGKLSRVEAVKGGDAAFNQRAIDAAYRIKKWLPAKNAAKPCISNFLLTVGVQEKSPSYLIKNEWARISGNTAVVLDLYKKLNSEAKNNLGAKKLSCNFKYPLHVMDDKIAGKIHYRVTVDKDDALLQAEIIKGLSPALDSAALLLLRENKDWVSAYQNGFPVRSSVEGDLMIHLPLGANSANADNASSSTNQVEKMAAFKGGNDAMFAFVKKNLRYPKEASDNKIKGRVITTFTIDTLGNVVDPIVWRGVHPLLDAEAIRIITKMPPWEPAVQRGKKVRMKFTLPVIFNF